MRQVTATEKFRAVNEGKMAKGEFVRQMRMAYPSFISQWNSYNDTVNILKNRGYITEKTGVDTYDSRMDLNISPNSIDRGVRYELAAQGVDPVEVKDKELVAKVTDRVVKNLKKDPLHYINLLAKESSNTDKHDREEEVKRGEAKKDVFNGEKKADLRENIESAKENIIKVASVIRGKYAEIPGFNSILKDFLQTHQDDIKAGKVTDPIAEFDDYIDLNYDRLDEQPVGEARRSDRMYVQDRVQEIRKQFEQEAQSRGLDIRIQYWDDNAPFPMVKVGRSQYVPVKDNPRFSVPDPEMEKNLIPNTNSILKAIGADDLVAKKSRTYDVILMPSAPVNEKQGKTVQQICRRKEKRKRKYWWY